MGWAAQMATPGQQANLAKSGREYFLLFFPTRPSDEYDSAPSRKYSRPLLDVFACIEKKIVSYTFKIVIINLSCQNNEHLFVMGVVVLLKKKEIIESLQKVFCKE